jgi:hypothetical protein
VEHHHILIVALLGLVASRSHAQLFISTMRAAIARIFKLGFFNPAST